MEHTYLFESARWRAEGFYHTKAGDTAPLTGETVLTRSETQWTLTGFMEVAFETPVRFENKYEIRATNNPAQFDWTSQNPALGTLQGAFIALPGIITSSYTTADGTYSGSEMMMQVSETEYKMQGVMNRDGDPENWWEGRLICDARG